MDASAQHEVASQQQAGGQNDGSQQQQQQQHQAAFSPQRPMPSWARNCTLSFNGKFTCEGYEFLDRETLTSMVCEPAGADPQARRAWSKQFREKVSLPLLRSMLVHHGIVHSTSAFRRDECLRLLREHLQNGPPDCSQVDPTTGMPACYRKAVKPSRFAEMRAEWDASCCNYAAELEAHPRRAEFDALATPEEQMRLDPDLFMDIYFLDRRTTPGLLYFPAADVDFEAAERAVKRLATYRTDLCLRIHRTVGFKDKKGLWLGWDPVATADAYYGALLPNDAPATTTYLLTVQQAEAAPFPLPSAFKLPVPEPLLLPKLEPQEEPPLAPFQQQQQQQQQQSLKRKHDELSDRGHNSVGTPGAPVRGIGGSYRLQFSGPGWDGQDCGPHRQWLDIRESATRGVYEATFNFDPAARGVLLLAARGYEAALTVHSDLLDTLDHYDPARHCVDHRHAFLQGLVLGMKRRRVDQAMPPAGRRTPLTQEEAIRLWAPNRHYVGLAGDVRPDAPPPPQETAYEFTVLCRWVRPPSAPAPALATFDGRRRPPSNMLSASGATGGGGGGGRDLTAENFAALAAAAGAATFGNCGGGGGGGSLNSTTNANGASNRHTATATATATNNTNPNTPTTTHTNNRLLAIAPKPGLVPRSGPVADQTGGFLAFRGGRPFSRFELSLWMAPDATVPALGTPAGTGSGGPTIKGFRMADHPTHQPGDWAAMKRVPGANWRFRPPFMLEP